MPTLDLQPAHLRTLLAIATAHAPDAEIWAYGSRVGGPAHEGSDLDLVVRNLQRLDAPQMNLHRLRDALTESDLPFLVEVLDWARIPAEFRREIERQHAVLMSPEHTPAK